jgi:DNA recombination protein RmuC
VDFALMYVPSESVYYEVVNSEPDLMAYAYKKRVMPVSPSTFYAFLRSVLLSFEGQQIASEIKSLQQNLAAIHNETTKFSELLSILQNHINNAYNMMSKVSTGFTSLFLRIDATKPLGFSHTTSPDKKRVLQGD